MIHIINFIIKIFQDDKGNISSIRIMLFLVFGFVLFLYFDWRNAFYIELQSGTPDYEGITTLFNAMIAGFVSLLTTIVAKIVQKSIENKK